MSKKMCVFNKTVFVEQEDMRFWKTMKNAAFVACRIVQQFVEQYSK